MNAIEAFVVLVNFTVLALVGAGRLDKIWFTRFIGAVLVGGLAAVKLGILRDSLPLGRLVVGIGLADLVVVATREIILAVRRRKPRAKGNILNRLRKTYSPTERRKLPKWDGPELDGVTRELEKQGFHACGDFEEVDGDAARGPMRAFLNADCTTAAFAFLRQDSRKNIQPDAVNFITELSGDRWVLTDPTPSKRSFGVLPRPPNIHRATTATGWSATTAAKMHAAHVAERLAQDGGVALTIENTFEGWCARRDAFWAQVCAYRKSVGWLTEAESIEMFGNAAAHLAVKRLLSAEKAIK